MDYTETDVEAPPQYPENVMPGEADGCGREHNGDPAYPHPGKAGYDHQAGYDQASYGHQGDQGGYPQDGDDPEGYGEPLAKVAADPLEYVAQDAEHTIENAPGNAATLLVVSGPQRGSRIEVPAGGDRHLPAAGAAGSSNRPSAIAHAGHRPPAGAARRCGAARRAPACCCPGWAGAAGRAPATLLVVSGPQRNPVRPGPLFAPTPLPAETPQVAAGGSCLIGRLPSPWPVGDAWQPPGHPSIFRQPLNLERTIPR